MKNYFTIVLFAGFIFRLFLASRAFPRLVFDALGYSEFAKGFLAGQLPIDCCGKNVGYGLFLAPIYALFGVDNLWAVRIVQIILDILTGFLLYFIALRLGKKKQAEIVYILYMLNPFTAAFTGLILAETVTIFLITLIGFVISRIGYASNRKHWFLTGILFGTFLFVRHSYYYFIFLFLMALCIFVIKRRNRFMFLAFTIAGFVLASSYSLLVYYKTFQIISLVPPYNLKFEIIYMNYYLWRYPEVVYKGPHPVYEEVVQGYWNTPLSEKSEHSKKYKQLFFQRLPREWQIFARNIAYNMIWLWDKDHIYTYEDAFYPWDRWPLRILNLSLLGLFLYGIISHIKKMGALAVRDPVVLLSIFMFLYMSFLFPLVSNESRHTLAFYSLLTFWAGMGLGRRLEARG